MRASEVLVNALRDDPDCKPDEGFRVEHRVVHQTAVKQKRQSDKKPVR